jgi:hypothetical protein
VISVLAPEYLLDLLFAWAGISDLTRRESISGRDGKNSYSCPDQVYKGGWISAVKDGVCREKKAANDVEELIGGRVPFQFLRGNHRISD